MKLVPLASIMLVAAMLAAPVAADNIDISAPALFEGRAMLIINGEKVFLKVGETGPEGVELVSSSSRQAVVKVAGREQVIKPGRKISSSFQERGRKSLTLNPVHGGHYVVGGSINGHGVEFMVDTGATFISMNQPTAERIGLDFRKGTPGRSSTAAGIVKVYRVVLDNVRIGDLEATEVEASVHEGKFPDVILLGNSFLSRMDISREGELLRIYER